MHSLNIVLAINHQIVSDGIARIIADEPAFSIQDTVRSRDEILETSFAKTDILLIDFDIPSIHEAAILAELLASHPELNVLAISEVRGPWQVKNAMKAGASGYLFKKRGTNELIQALKSISNGEKYLCNKALSIIVEDKNHSETENPPSALTDRELEVLVLICEEMTNREIAEKLHISVRTVDAHRQHLLQKTGAQNTAGLVKYAIRHQLFRL